jgi:hypothetical protein
MREDSESSNEWDLYAAEKTNQGELVTHRLEGISRSGRGAWMGAMDVLERASQDRWLLLERSRRNLSSALELLAQPQPMSSRAFALQVMDIVGAAMDWLSTMRLYIDHTSARLGESDRDALGGFQRVLSAQYDSRFGYRFCARLRNYAVHQGLPIHTVALRAESGLGPALRLSASTLVARYNGWSTVKAELLSGPEDIDLIANIDEAMLGLDAGARWVARHDEPDLRSALRTAHEMRAYFSANYNGFLPVVCNSLPAGVGDRVSLTPVWLWTIDAVEERLAELT